MSEMPKSYKQLCEFVAGVMDENLVTYRGRPNGKIAYDIVSLMPADEQSAYHASALFKATTLAVKRYLQSQKDEDGNRTIRARRDEASKQLLWEDWMKGPPERVQAVHDQLVSELVGKAKSLLQVQRAIRQHRPDVMLNGCERVEGAVKSLVRRLVSES